MEQEPGPGLLELEVLEPEAGQGASHVGAAVGWGEGGRQKTGDSREGREARGEGAGWAISVEEGVGETDTRDTGWGRRDNRSGGEGDGEDAQQGGGGANTMVAARNSMHGMLATIWMAL